MRQQTRMLLIFVTCIQLTRPTQCKLRSEVNHIDNFNSAIRKNNTILIGVLNSYRLISSSLTSFATGQYYASSMFVAIDEINKNKNLLPNHEVQLVWGDTECNITKTLQLQDRFEKIGVDVFIGGGCADCEMAAKAAEEKNMLMISYHCRGGNLAATYKTFVETALTFNHLFSEALQALFRYYKWKKFVVVVEDSKIYKWTLSDVLQTFGDQVIATATVSNPVSYHFGYDMEGQIKPLKEKARIIVILASFSIMKEVLVTAADLGMTNGKYVFLKTMLDVSSRNYEKFRWNIVDFALNGSHTAYVQRSERLCEAYKSSLLIAVEPFINYKATGYSDFMKKIKLGMLKWFNESTYDGIIPATNYSKSLSKPPVQAAQMYDAIIFYATAVNKLLSENKDYKSVINVRNWFHGAVVTGINGYTYRYGMKGELYHALHLYQLKDAPGMEDLKCFKELQDVGDFIFTFFNHTMQTTFERQQDVPLLYPGGLENVSNEPELCINCKSSKAKKKMSPLAISVLVVVIICVLLVIGVVVVRYCRNDERSLYRRRLRHVVDDDRIPLEEEEDNETL